MNHQEAKQLLELCRPGNEADRQDPALAEAFALLETDAGLKAWFDAQQVVDARISESLNQLEIPADLKASILAGMRLHHAHAEQLTPEAPETPELTGAAIPFEQATTTTTSELNHSTRASHAWWQNPWTGIAALFVIMMVVINLPSNSATNEPTAQTNPNAPQVATAGLPSVIQFLSSEIDSLKSNRLEFDKRDERAENLQTFLASTQAPSPRSIPNCLNKMPTIGCITFEYQNAKLSMICFKDGNVYHLITAEKASYPDALPITPEIYQCKDKAFKIWVDGEQVKILTVHGTKEDIPEFI